MVRSIRSRRSFNNPMERGTMQEIRYAKVNNLEVPVLISDEKEALLSAKADGRAIIGLWDPEKPDRDLSPALFLVEDVEDADEELLERVARRHLGFPWKICETKRLVIREIRGEDFTEIWDNQIGHGFLTLEDMESYTKNQYIFYGFGFWALAEKESGELVGVAGLTVPKADADTDTSTFELSFPNGEGELELGYHIFSPFRKKGYAFEACEAILRYGRDELELGMVTARISKDNVPSLRLAERLGFHAAEKSSDMPALE